MKDAIYKLPKEFLQRVKALYPHQYNEIVSTFLKKKQPAFRVNYVKADLQGIKRKIASSRLRATALEFPRGAFLLKSELRQLQKTRMYNNGEIFVQNISSMVVPFVLDAKEGDKILDLCAAPGAKTTQILSLQPKIDMIALDKSRTRYYKLLANLKDQGLEGKARVMVLDGIWVRKKFPEEFDKILLDAPCSAEGRFYVLNPRSYAYWKLRKIKEAVSKQKQLLNAAFYALKEGGEMVYSTCTFAPEENEAMVDWFLKKYKEKIELLPVKFSLENSVYGIKRWKSNRFRFNPQYVRRIIPNNYLEGFFIAKFRKISA